MEGRWTEGPWARSLVAVWAVAMAAWIATTEAGSFGWTFDDSFYYLEIARNLAEGHGSTFDRINQTNGYHPLWMGICWGLFAAGLDGMAAVRVALLLQLLTWTAVAVAGLTGLRRLVADEPPLIRGAVMGLGALLATNPAMANVAVNGLEGAVSLPIHAAILWWLGRSDRPIGERSGLLGLSVLLVAAFLARTDGGLLTLTVLLAGLLRGGPGVWMAKVGALPAASLLLFLGANQLVFDTPMQVSGDLKRVVPGPLQWVGVVALVGLAAALFRVGTEGGFPRLRRFVVRTWAYGAFTCAIVAYYTCFQTFARVWYFVPLMLWFVGLACVGAADLLALGLAEAREKDPEVGTARAVAPLLGMMLLLVGGASVGAHAALLGGEGHTSRQTDAEAGRWIGENLPADVVLASWDAGVIGYFAPQSVVNLDGVVNSVAYRDAMRSGTTPELVRQWRPTYLVNHCEELDELREAARLNVGETAMFEVEHRWPFTVRGGVNGVGMGEHQMEVLLIRIAPR